jgi:hypothetical protein
MLGQQSSSHDIAVGKLIPILTALAAIALLPGIVAEEISKSVPLIANSINSQP